LHLDWCRWIKLLLSRRSCWQQTSSASQISESIGTTQKRHNMRLPAQLWSDDSGQDIVEYTVMLAVILVIVVGTIRLIGSKANNVFSEVASSMQ
jgi:Flp pilus assembly pilin Flp